MKFKEWKKIIFNKQNLRKCLISTLAMNDRESLTPLLHNLATNKYGKKHSNQVQCTFLVKVETAVQQNIQVYPGWQ